MYGMYDPLTSTYTLSCPNRGESRVHLSAFRALERLPGAAHPAVYRIEYACGCGEEHPALVSHDELDWAPLGLAEGAFLNLMTSRLDAVAPELGDHAARRIGAGEWPWTLLLLPGGAPEAGLPVLVLPPRAPAEGWIGLAVHCPVCSAVSVNLVSHEHVDVPFHNDPRVGVIAHVFDGDAARTLEEFRDDLYSARFDARRLDLD